jgi:hypothetical protein
MSSFRRGKSEASLRLYSLPRRELQALCKQYGIPTNKTNVAMADALSACVPVSFVPVSFSPLSPHFLLQPRQTSFGFLNCWRMGIGFEQCRNWVNPHCDREVH